MPKPWAREKNKRRKQKLLEEQQSVSTPIPLPAPAAPLSTPSRSIFVHQVSDHPFRAELPPFAYDENGDRIPDEYDAPASMYPLACSPIPDPPSTPPPRDLSALRSTASAHPWRTIRRRNHRLLPERSEPRPFPRSLPKRTVISADILTIHDHLPNASPPLPPPRKLQSGLLLRPADLLDLLPPLHPIGPDDPFYSDEVPSIDMPAPSLCPCPADHLPHPVPPPAPSLPADTSYGVVQSSLALACTTAIEKNLFVAVSDVVSVAWGPHGSYREKGLLAQLPGDQLVFLCMLTEFVRLEPVFAEFLHPAIIDFTRGWVNHCRREDAGA